MPVVWLTKWFKRPSLSREERCARITSTVESLLRADKARRNEIDKAREELVKVAQGVRDEDVMAAVRQEISRSKLFHSDDPEWQIWIQRFRMAVDARSTSLDWIEIVHERIQECALRRSRVHDLQKRRIWDLVDLFEDARLHPAVAEYEHRRAALARLAFFDLDAAKTLMRTWMLNAASERLRAVEHRKIAWRRVQAFEAVLGAKIDPQQDRKVHELAVGIRSATGVPGVGFWDIEDLHVRADGISRDVLDGGSGT